MKLEFGVILKRLRTENHLTQVELAQQMNTSISVISMLEQNKRVPTIEMLEMYAEIFQADMHAIIQECYEISGKPKMLKEESASYQVHSQADMQILTTIKQNSQIYEKLLKNPESVIELLNDILEATEKYNKNKY